ncbi:MAG: sugar transferase [Verrucomicrobiota bacterium]
MRLKRLLDLIVVLSSGVIWVPLSLFLALLVWSKLGRPVIFKQARPGYLGKVFTLWKFRNPRLLPGATPPAVRSPTVRG